MKKKGKRLGAITMAAMTFFFNASMFRRQEMHTRNSRKARGLLKKKTGII